MEWINWEAKPTQITMHFFYYNICLLFLQETGIKIKFKATKIIIIIIINLCKPGWLHGCITSMKEVFFLIIYILFEV